jgi:hypothetical protein
MSLLVGLVDGLIVLLRELKNSSRDESHAVAHRLGMWEKGRAIRKPGREDRRLQSRLGECPWDLRSLIVVGHGRWSGLLLSGLAGEDVVGEEGGEMGCMLRDYMGLG